VSLLTCRQVADDAVVSIRTVQRWVKDGDLAAIVLPGNRIRIDPDVWAAAQRSWTTTPGHTKGGILPRVCPSEEE
jgi:predicted site-specific integrase-resolvase